MSSSFKIRPTHFSCGGKIFLGRLRTPWLRACGHLYITKKQTFTCVLYVHSQFLCSLARFDLANQGVRQPVHCKSIFKVVRYIDFQNIQVSVLIVTSEISHALDTERVKLMPKNVKLSALLSKN